MASAAVAEEMDRDMYPRLSDATSVTVDAVGAMAPETEPASPVSARGGAWAGQHSQPAHDFGMPGSAASQRLPGHLSAEELAAASDAMGSTTDVVAQGSPVNPHGVDALAATTGAGAEMSSSSYFKPYMKSQSAAAAAGGVPPERGPAVQKTSSAPMQDPFPMARETVLMGKLADASQEVRGLCSTINEAMERPQIHPLEVRQILKAAEGVAARRCLSEAELEQVGWPSRTIRQLREVSSCLEVWERCEEGAKQAIASDQAALRTLTTALEQLMAGWCQLCQLERYDLRLDMGLERRATAAGPMVSALLDKAMGLLRQAPDVVVARQLESLLQRGAKQKELEGLGVASSAAQHLQEIEEVACGRVPTDAVGPEPGGEAPAPDARLAAPELLWKAVVDGDARTVQTVIQHGGLVSGRTQDPQGHSVFWDALAFQRVEVATVLFRHFPPGMPHGVFLGEQHKRNGNSLLHLIAGFTKFSQSAEALFSALFEQAPDGLKAHRNKKGQTVAHTAASRLNFWVLRFLAARGLDSLFTVEDGEGMTPRKLLERTLDSWGVPGPLEPPDASASRMPSWCPLGSFQPPAAGHRPPLADVVVTVEDAARGRVDFHAHRVILASMSDVWHRALEDEVPPEGAGGASGAVLLALGDGQCSSAEAALFALRFLYTGEVDCPFRSDPGVLLQLLRLCAACALPPPLCAVALDALCHHVEVPEVARELLHAVFPADAPRVHAPASHRAYIARCFVGRDVVWGAVEGSSRAKILEKALAALEPALMACQERHARSQAVASVAVGAGGQPLSTGPLGSGWLRPPEAAAAGDPFADTRSEAPTMVSFHRLG